MSKFTDWVRELPCCVTGHTGGCDPHHIKGYSWLVGSGCSSKGEDLFCIPLRHDLHRELHDIGWQAWEQKYNRSQLEEAVRVIKRAADEGLITINL